MEWLVVAALNTLISSLTASVMYGVWKWFAKRCEAGREIGAAYWMLRTLLLVLLLPFLPMVLWLRSGYGHYGFLYMETPVIRAVVSVLAVVWTAGVAWNLKRYLLEMVRYNQLYRNMMECNVHMCRLANQIAGQMKLRHRVRLVEGYEILSSELGSWYYPMICLPVRKYDDEALINIVTHELVHFKNGDKLVREIMLFLMCFHWFNPICREIIKELRIWDEYHCDYETCCYEHIKLGSYCETLYDMFKLEERRKSLITPGFAEKKSDLRRRLEKMRNYGNLKPKSRFVILAVTIAFAVAGVVTGVMASEGVAYAYDKVVKASVVADAAEIVNGNGENGELIEYTMVPDGTLELNYVEADDIMPLDLQGFSCTLKNQIYSTSSFKLEIGDKLTVSTGIKPSDVEIKVGIQQPNGVWRYVVGSGNIMHTFEITQKGSHKVFVWNETNTEVNVVGYYNFD